MTKARTGGIEEAHGLLWVVMITSAESRGWPGDVTVGNLAMAGLPVPSAIRTEITLRRPDCLRLLAKSHGNTCVKPGATASETELAEVCARTLGQYKRPGKVVLRAEALPKTPVGKIRRKELREPYWAGQARRVSGS